MINCPNCGSSSGIDCHGRNFCHACHKDFNNKDLIKKDRPQNRLELPEWDPLAIFPKEAENYLNTYHLIRTLDMFWSSVYNRLCFPYYAIKSQLQQTQTMIGCWMRDITNQSSRKWLYAGMPKSEYNWVYHTDPEDDRGHETASLCIVEDCISALRVSKHMDCLSLGGTSWNTTILYPLLKEYDDIYIFLDNDDAGHRAMQKFIKEFNLLIKIHRIRGLKDPKLYTDTELEETLFK